MSLRVLVAIDESRESMDALRQVAALPLDGRDEVIAVCLVETATAVAYGAGGGPGTAGMLLSPLPSTLIDPGPGIAATARAILARTDATRRVALFEGAPGRLLPDLIAESEPDLVVIPARLRRSRLAGTVLGDPWRDVIAACPVPVLLARDHGGGRTAVLVGVDAAWSVDDVRALGDLPLPAEGEVVLVESTVRGSPAPDRWPGGRGAVGRWLHRLRSEGELMGRAEAGVDAIVAMGRDLDAQVIVVGVPRAGAGLGIDADVRRLADETASSVLLVPIGERSEAGSSRPRGTASRVCQERACREPAISLEITSGTAPAWCISHWLEQTGAPLVA